MVDPAQYRRASGFALYPVPCALHLGVGCRLRVSESTVSSIVLVTVLSTALSTGLGQRPRRCPAMAGTPPQLTTDCRPHTWPRGQPPPATARRGPCGGRPRRRVARPHAGRPAAARAWFMIRAGARLARMLRASPGAGRAWPVAGTRCRHVGGPPARRRALLAARSVAMAGPHQVTTSILGPCVQTALKFSILSISLN